MTNDGLIKTLILSISFMGLTIFGIGLVFLTARGFVSQNLRYILPVPPIGVAAYVFVYTLFIKFDGQLPPRFRMLILEVAWATLISSMVFLVCSIMIIGFIKLVLPLV